MGKKLRKEAKNLGFLKYPKTTIYGGAAELILVREWGTFTTSVPIWAIDLGVFLENLDPDLKLGISKPDRNKIIFLLAPNIHVYIEIDAKTAGFLDSRKNHVQQINIYSRDKKFISEIARVINSSYKGGILKEIIWEKIEKKFSINQEQEIQIWKDILEQPV